MQGISRSKHVQLLDTIISLENALQVKGDDADLEQIQAYKQELEHMYVCYFQMLKELSDAIYRYEKLSKHVRTGFLAKKMKTIK